jgi:hypothetical protein
MKILKFLTLLSVLFFSITAFAIILGWIKFINGISPLIFGISFLSMTTAMHLIKNNQSKLKWFSFSLALIGFLILSMATLKILELKDFWLFGLIMLSISLVIGLFYQIQLVTHPKGKFLIIGLLMSVLLIVLLILIGLKFEKPIVYNFGKIVLAFFTIFALFGSFLKPKNIKS